MPRKKKKAEEPIVVQPEVEKVEEKQEEQETCNHRNMHYTAGVLTCQMAKDHTGLHSAFLNNNFTFWSDAAGTPVRKHA